MVINERVVSLIDSSSKREKFLTIETLKKWQLQNLRVL